MACKWGDATHLNSVKWADPKTKSIVFGFIRITEAIYQTNIPSDIVLICLMYYYNPEYFTKTGQHMILQDNGQTVIHDDIPYRVEDAVGSDYDWSDLHDYANTAYGNLEINPHKYVKCVWNFKITDISKNVTIAIGIASDPTDTGGSFHANKTIWELMEIPDKTRVHYGYETKQNSSLMYTYEIDKLSHCSKKYGCVWNDNDEVQMEFDLEKKILRYYVNGQDQGIAVENVICSPLYTFVMAICLNGPAVVKLTNFKPMHK